MNNKNLQQHGVLLHFMLFVDLRHFSNPKVPVGTMFSFAQFNELWQLVPLCELLISLKKPSHQFKLTRLCS